MKESAEKPKHVSERKIAKTVRPHRDKAGITKKELFAILDKASQPVKHEAESASESSGT